MNNFAIWLQNIAGIIPVIFLFIVGYFATFRTDTFRRFYLKRAQKYYLKSLKNTFILAKYYQAYTKYNYERMKRQYQSKRHYYETKIVGVLAIFMASLISFAIISTFFNHKL